jgi:hypothetical protein
MDGSALVDQTDSLRAALSQASPPSSPSASSRVTRPIGGLVSIIISELHYMLFI